MGCAPSRPELRRSVAHPARPHLFGKHYLLAKTYAAWYGALVHARAFRVATGGAERGAEVVWVKRVRF